MIKDNKCIILANGKPPAKSVLSFLTNRGYSILICADGGANSAKKLNVLPNYIIGDLDSITNNTLKYYTERSEIIKIKRQNDTDVEKCIKFAIKKKLNDIVLVGVTGDRLDHTFCNLGIVDRKSTRLNSSHLGISYAVFCLKKKKNKKRRHTVPICRRRKDNSTQTNQMH